MAAANRRQRGEQPAPFCRPAGEPRAAGGGRGALGGRGPVPRGGTALRRAAGRIARRVDTLPDEQRDVVALRYFLDLSEEDVAETLGIPRGTVKSRTARALERLRESYD